ncbi:MAG: hypothetical protein ACJ8GN_02315 [Longimicrobiaceae bacterium]
MKLGLTALAAAALAALSAGGAAAQRGMIAEGMTPAQVRDIFGAPARTRDAGEWSYWFYSNGCPVRCGSDDVVFFRNEKVVAAVLRTRVRLISGPGAATALERAGGDIDADAIRAQAGEAPPVRSAPARIRVQGRSRADAEAEEAAGQARVGRIHAESGGRVIDREPVGQVRDVAPADSAGSTIIRAPAGQGQPQGAAAGARGVRNPVGTAPDSVQGAPATAVDDERAAREGEVRRNTVPQTDTTQARRLNREKSVTPRVVPRP